MRWLSANTTLHNTNNAMMHTYTKKDSNAHKHAHGDDKPGEVIKRNL